MTRKQREMFEALETVIGQAYLRVGDHIADENARKLLGDLADDHIGWIRKHHDFISAMDDEILRQESRLERAGL